MKRSKSRMQMRSRVRTRQRISMKATVAISTTAISLFVLVYVYGNFGNSTKLLAAAPTNDNKANATSISTPLSWTSSNAAYTTVGATADGTKGQCWSDGPNYNVWFKFVAPGSSILVSLSSGGAYGTLKSPYLSILDSVGTNISCAQYVSTTGTLKIGSTTLRQGALYYISVDNKSGTSNRGTFTLSCSNQITFDDKDGAELIANPHLFSSVNAAYSTTSATPDGQGQSCFGGGPKNNVWFKFQATTPFIDIQLKSGSSFGTLQNPYVSLYNSSGTELNCIKYSSSTGTLELSYSGLTIGNWYYIEIDNESGNSGTFTLLVDDQYTSDYYEGAVELTQFSNWTSPLATYTTVNATPDRIRPLCWNTGPNNNVWFKFNATTPSIQVDVLTGGSYGTLTHPYLAVYNSLLGQLACAKFSTGMTTLSLIVSGLVIGTWNYVSVDNLQGKEGTFTLRFNGFNPLPIELASFKAKANNESVLVDWKTASELNNDYFTVERSQDGRVFTPIERIPGAGNTTETKSYQYEDKNPLDGTSYYRLRQTDYDGTTKSFEPVSVKFESTIEQLEIRSFGPNPFSDGITLEVYSPTSGDLTIEIYSLSGNLVHTGSMSAWSGVNTLRISSLDNLTPGMYILVIRKENEKSNQIRIIKK